MVDDLVNVIIKLNKHNVLLLYKMFDYWEYFDLALISVMIHDWWPLVG